MATNHDGKARPALGMNSFDDTAFVQWGRSIRVAMALVNRPTDSDDGWANTNSSFDATPDATPDADLGYESPNGTAKARLPTDQLAICKRLKTLSRSQSANLADQIELLVRFDDLQGWESSGFKHCVAWMNFELGVSDSLAWEYLRVGRELRRLSTLTALFRSGSLTWSKVRLISRVADEESELLLCHAALDAPVSDVVRVCREFRWKEESAEDEARDENARALHQFESRSLSWRSASNGNTEFRLCLPPEQAGVFLRGLEHSMEQLDSDVEQPGHSPDSEASSDVAGQTDSDEKLKIGVTHRRADAAVLMAERSLAFGGSVTRADRYLVVINADAEELATCGDLASQEQAGESAGNTVNARKPCRPKRRPVINGTGPVARESARRIACDAGLVSITSKDGEPLSITRKSRLWTPAMSRAIHHRDQHCQWPGCTATRHLHIHHIIHWADGGSTSVENGVLCCQTHHVLLHEGGYRFERADNVDSNLDDQFSAQTARTDKADQCDEEFALRNNRASFDAVRALLPTRYRFVVTTPDGKDINDAVNSQNAQCVKSAMDAKCGQSAESPQHCEVDKDSTRVESALDTAANENQISEPMAVYQVAGSPAGCSARLPCRSRRKNSVHQRVITSHRMSA